MRERGGYSQGMSGRWRRQEKVGGGESRFVVMVVVMWIMH